MRVLAMEKIGPQHVFLKYVLVDTTHRAVFAVMHKLVLEFVSSETLLVMFMPISVVAARASRGVDVTASRINGLVGVALTCWAPTAPSDTHVVASTGKSFGGFANQVWCIAAACRALPDVGLAHLGSIVNSRRGRIYCKRKLEFMSGGEDVSLG